MDVVRVIICCALVAVAMAANGLKQARLYPDHFPDKLPEISDELLKNLSPHFDNPMSPEKMTDQGVVTDCTQYILEQERKEGKEPTEQSLRFITLSYLDSLYGAEVSDPEKRRQIMLDSLNKNLEIMSGLKRDLERCSTTPVTTMLPIEELIAEVSKPGFVGSVRGIPGVSYPIYTEVPLTSFSCSDKEYIPGFYADLETRCQVFHICYEHRRESFLCPVGTVFNQPILACDYWYNSNCSQAPHYFDVNAESDTPEVTDEVKEDIEEMITTIIEHDKPALPHISIKTKDTKVEAELEQVFKFLPVKAKVVELTPEPVVTPEPVIEHKVVEHPTPTVKVVERVVPIESIADIAMAKVTAAKAVPLLKAKVAGKAKMAAAAAVPVIKAKLAAEAFSEVKSKVADVLKTKREIAAPVLKVKGAAAIPLFKAKVAAKKIPAVKASLAVEAKLMAKKAPLAKAALAVEAKLAAAMKAKKLIAVPFLKPKIMISPMTKKALALGYMKLLKAKKFALMG